MATTVLDIDEDAADDLRDEIEAAFGVRFLDDELVAMSTVGDLHACLMDKLRRDGGNCAASMAFYRLRRALRGQGVQGPVVPSTPLQLGTQTPRAFLSRIALDSGMRDLRGASGFLGNVSVWTGMAGFVVLIVSGLERSLPLLGVGLTLMLVTFVLARLDTGRLPEGVVTVGDLTRYAVTRNHGSLIVQGAAVRDQEVWASLQRIVGDCTGYDTSQIGAETRFFAPKSKRAA